MITGWECTYRSVAVVIIIIVLVCLITYFFFRNWIQDAKRAQTEGVIGQCMADIPFIQNTSWPEYYSNQYDSEWAKILLNACLATSQNACYPNKRAYHIPQLPRYQIFQAPDPYDGKQRMFAAAFSNDRDMMLVFNGTMFRDEWINDADFRQVAPNRLRSYRSGMLVHRGFWNVYQTVREDMIRLVKERSPQNLIITGHSLGGALSTLAAMDYPDQENLYHYSFASPRVGNQLFAEIYQQTVPVQFRVANTEDLVPELPPSVVGTNHFQHVLGLVHFSINLNSAGENHVKAYLDGIGDQDKYVLPMKNNPI